MHLSSTLCRLVSQNRRISKQLWPNALNPLAVSTLKEMTCRFHFSVAMGDLLLMGRSWYVTHNGLIRLSQRRRCFAIAVEPVENFCESRSSRWVFRAAVYKCPKCQGFVGYGDADPSNVTPGMHGAELRIAETRAVNRALRKAYGIGICSVEEIGSFPATSSPVPILEKNSSATREWTTTPINASRVRDRLCQLIRQHQLDPNLVKSYAMDFCGAKVLRDATREQLEKFVTQLGDQAARDRDALLNQLNSYSWKIRTVRHDTTISGTRSNGRNIRTTSS